MLPGIVGRLLAAVTTSANQSTLFPSTQPLGAATGTSRNAGDGGPFLSNFFMKWSMRRKLPLFCLMKKT